MFHSLSNVILTVTIQPPDKVKEKAEWRLLMSKKVCSCLREVMESSDPVEQCNDPGQDDRLKQGNRSSQPDRLRLEDSELKLVSTSPASTVSSGQPGDRLDSVFLTSLSAVSGTGYFGGEGMPHRSQKVYCTHGTATCVCVCVYNQLVPRSE